jgi:hypothetical protein
MQSGLYNPRSQTEFLSGEQFLYWKTDEKGPYVPPFDEIKEKVKARWLADKARPHAEEEAKRVAEKIRGLKLTGAEAGPTAVRTLREETKYAGVPFVLDRVAPLTEPRAAMPSQQGGHFEPYQIPQSKVEHPSPEMLKKLLELKNAGDAVVVHDQPRDHYYVAVLEHRAQVYPLAFFFDASQPYKRGGLIQKFEVDTKERTKQLESVLEQLRAQAGLVIDEVKLNEAKTKPETE